MGLLNGPAGGTCGTKPCWKAAGVGFAYTDRTTASDGIGKLSLKPGAAAKAKVGLKATGPNLRFPTLPLAAPVRVQLRSAAGGCFEAVFSAPSANDAVQYKAKSD
jgi:hypothetical protein